MTTKDAKNIIHSPCRPLVIVALSYVNLTDQELETLVLRHMRGHTQQNTAEEMDMSVNGIQNIEKAALIKCAEAWEDLTFIKQLFEAAP